MTLKKASFILKRVCLRNRLEFELMLNRTRHCSDKQITSDDVRDGDDDGSIRSKARLRRH